jgi:cell fate (sporulation/competence/biofilm development) regulator YlbF (YheA/YmcA/DUF963 family)
MNQSVIEKAQELAQLIAKSTEYISMRAAEEAATKDEQLTAAFSNYEEKRAEIEQLTMQENPDYQKLGALSRELEELQGHFNAFPMAQALQNARKGFTDMMAQVNLELQKVLAPEETESGCGGHCDSCAGCHHD